MNKTIEEAGNRYAEFLIANTKQKLQLWMVLRDIAENLIQFKLNTKNLQPWDDDLLQWKYLSEKVSRDVLATARHMAFTKQFDSSPRISEMIQVAYKLMSATQDKSNHELLPFVSQVIGTSQNKSYSETDPLWIIYDQCLADLQDYNKSLQSRERPWYIAI
jgi:hypothetical protein